MELKRSAVLLATCLVFFTGIALIQLVSGAGGKVGLTAGQPGIRTPNTAGSNEIVVVAYLSNVPEDISGYLKDSTRDLTSRIDALRKDIKSRYAAVADELEPIKEQVLAGLQSSDPMILAQIKMAEEKHGASESQTGPLIKELVDLNQQRSELITRLLRERLLPFHEEARSQIESVGGAKIISEDFMPSSFAIKTTEDKIREIGALPAIKEVALPVKGQPMLDVSVPSIYANIFWGNGYNGNHNNSINLDIKVLDTGIYMSHPFLSSHNFQAQEAPAGACSLGDPVLTDHGTMVAGAIASTHSTWRGVAYGIATISPNSDIYNAMLCPSAYWNDALTLINWNIADTEVVSHSMGWGLIFGCSHDGTSQISRDVDAKISSYPDMVWVNAGGNIDPFGICVDDSFITWPADAYNVIAAGGINDFGTTNRNDDRIWSYSRLGPAGTPGAETRIKPDVVAPGVGIVSTYPPSGWAYADGTSFSAPHVSGSVLLMMDAGITDGLDVRALLINSADDWSSIGPSNSGPDNTYGYGYINLYNAWFEKGYIESGDLSATTEREYFRISSPSNGDKLTMVWNQYVNPSSIRYYSNLDYAVYDESTSAQLYATTAVYNNREQYAFSSSYSNAVVKAKRVSGTIPGTVDYSIASSRAITKINNPPTYTITINTPSEIKANEQFLLTVDVRNDGEFAVKNVLVDLTLPADWQIVSGADPQNIGTINPSQTKQASWTVKPGGVGSNKLIEVDVSGSNFGESFTGSKQKYVNVGEGGSQVPVLISPVDNFDYILGQNLYFKWQKAPGTNPSKYYMKAWRDGVLFSEYIPPNGLDLGLATSLTLPAKDVEIIAKDGTWEWAIGAKIGSVVYWSEKRVINKHTAAVLIAPLNGASVQPNELFDWNDVPIATNYVAKVTGLLPAGQPYYMPLNSQQSKFVLTQAFYNELKSGVTYSWAVAGTALGNPLSASDQRLSKLSYGTSRSFYKG